MLSNARYLWMLRSMEGPSNNHQVALCQIIDGLEK